MTPDRIEHLGDSLIQHGPANDRIYLMKLGKEDSPEIISQLVDLALSNNYSKIFAKVPAARRKSFEEAGFSLEAAIPRFYNGRDDGLFMARYLHPDRLIDHSADRVQEVLSAARNRMSTTTGTTLPGDSECRLMATEDCAAMAELYRRIFASYPFPIHDPAYLARTMIENIIYAGIVREGQLVAVASAEIDKNGRNAEMTDFATDQRCQGQGLANHLLGKLEEVTAALGIRTCYTIARATSFGMNICFAKNGYAFGGTLVKNTQISGSLESMNVWYKHPPEEAA